MIGTTELETPLDQPSPLYLEIEVLDRIADGATLEDLDGDAWSALCTTAGWMDEFLPAVNWWRTTALNLLGTADLEGACRPVADLASQRDAIARLLAATLEAFVPAMRESVYYGVPDGEIPEPCMELLRRYRRFTRYICAFAQELRLDIDLEKLLARP